MTENRYGLDINQAIEDVRLVINDLLLDMEKLESNILIKLYKLRSELYTDLDMQDYQEYLKGRLLRDLYIIAKNEYEGNGNYKILYAFLNLIDRKQYQLEIEEEIYRYRFIHL